MATYLVLSPEILEGCGNVKKLCPHLSDRLLQILISAHNRINSTVHGISRVVNLMQRLGSC